MITKQKIDKEELNRQIELRNEQRQELCDDLIGYCENKIRQENITRRDIFRNIISSLNKKGRMNKKQAEFLTRFLVYDRNIVRISDYHKREEAKHLLRRQMELISSDYEKRVPLTFDDILGE